MSRMASAVSCRMASGSTWRNVCPFASKVDTPFVVMRRYEVVSFPSGSISWYSKSGIVPQSAPAQAARDNPVGERQSFDASSMRTSTQS